MKTKAAIAGHPIHPALVAFPVAFYTATVLALVAFELLGDAFWFRVALVANIGGVATALIAAIPGAIDLFTTLPDRSPARRTGLKHAALNVAALTLFAISAGFLWGEWRGGMAADGGALDATPPLVVALAGLLCTAAAGALGWKLVQPHHVGVDDGEARRRERDTLRGVTVRPHTGPLPR